jgi:hypothetical protein
MNDIAAIGIKTHSEAMERMIISADPDIQAVAEFMQRSIPMVRLVGVATGVAAIAPLLWGRYECESVPVLKLSDDGPQTQSVSTGSVPGLPCADDGSAVAKDVPA